MGGWLIKRKAVGLGRNLEKIRNLEKWECGMITVEASVIIPTIACILVLILFLFFYGYESGVCAGILREEVSKMSDTIKTQGNIDTGEYQLPYLAQRKLTYLLSYDSGSLQNRCKENIREKLAKNSLFASNHRVSIEVSHGQIEGEITANIEIPLLGAVQIGGFSLFEVRRKVRQKIQMPAEEIRRWKAIGKSDD